MGDIAAKMRMEKAWLKETQNWPPAKLCEMAAVLLRNGHTPVEAAALALETWGRLRDGWTQYRGKISGSGR
jgi:hypothetical protein